MEKKKIFFAYTKDHQENKDAISRAAQNYNSYQGSYEMVLWENIKQSANVIGSKVFNAIKDCEIFACDLTYLNHNVFFELGYAIAQKKRLKIFLNNNIKNALQNYKAIKILSNIEFTPFSTSKEISGEFQQNITSSSLQIKDFLPNYEEESIENDVFFINIKNKNQAADELEEYLPLLYNIKYIINNKEEIAYQPFVWYLKSIIKSEIIILHLVGIDKIDFDITNAEYSLYAGIAFGLEKKVLLLAPEPFYVPVDYSDILIEYSSTNDCLNKTEAWLKNIINEQKKNGKEIIGKIKNDEIDHELNLLKLGIGCGVAEHEELSSTENFVEIDAFNESINPNRKKIIVIGRKGSGKTEIFRRLNEVFIADNNNFIIIIKPDYDEILGNIEFTNLYYHERSKHALFIVTWKYVIYSKIFLDIVKNIITTNLEEEDKINIIKYHSENKDMFGVNFFGMINYISKQFPEINITKDIVLIDKIYEKIKLMVLLVNKYLEKKKFKIIILADNLDAGWDPKNNLEYQSIMINTLFEYIDKLKNEIGNPKVNIRSVLFLRKDIFSFILKDAHDSDKLIMDSYEINWEKFPNLLITVVNNRLISVLDGKEKIDDIWNNYFSFEDNIYPFDKIQKVIIKRPRDAIYFMSRLFESAVNHDKIKVDNSDFKYALEEYSKFLYNNIILEIRAVFPKIEDLLCILKAEYPLIMEETIIISLKKFCKIIDKIDSNTDKDKLLKALMDDNYIIGIFKSSEREITNFNELLFKRNERVFKIFKKNKILLKFQILPLKG
ncbi:MAG: hypothetical protein LBH16_06265 [Treponema sp.]|nr:hypothetical protein [Treponema sp.]